MSVRGVVDCACHDLTPIGGSAWLRGRASIPRALEMLRSDGVRVRAAFDSDDYAQPVPARFSRCVHVDGLHVTSVHASDDGSGPALWPVRKPWEPPLVTDPRYSVTEVRPCPTHP